MASVGIRKTASGRHKVYWRLDDYSQGSETFDTSEEAKRYRDRLRVELRDGTWIDPRRGKVLFADWATEWWDTWAADPARSPTTLEAADGRLRLHLRPTFDRKELRAISVMSVRRWQHDLAGKGLGHESIMACRSLLYRILQAAVDDRRIETNPVAKVSSPKRRVDPEVALGRARRRVLTPEEFGELVAAALPFWRDHLVCLVGTGLRAGELLGLRAARVDLDAARLEVLETRYDAGKFGRGYKDRPKSDAGIRVVPLARPVVEAIKRRLPDNPRPSDLVFTGPGGANHVRAGTRTELSRDNLRRAYQRARDRAHEDGRLKHLDLRGPHDLRHTFATWLENGGIPARVIDELMGHQGGHGERHGSAIGTRYRHTTDAMAARVVRVLERDLTEALKVAARLLPE